MNPLAEYFHLQLGEALRSRRVVVWYDEPREFSPFTDGLERTADLDALRIVNLGGIETRIAIFDGSFFALRLEVEPHVEATKPEPLLIYVPGEHPSEKESPLKELECAGVLYQRSLSKVAKQLLKRTYTEGTIDEMFRDKQLGYDDVARLLEPHEDRGGSILKLVLGDLDAASLLAKWLDGPSLDAQIEAKGGRTELTTLVTLRCGLSLDPTPHPKPTGETPVPRGMSVPPMSEESGVRAGLSLADTSALSDCRDQLCRFLLINEFRQNLKCAEPTSISMMPRAGLKEQREFNGRVLDRLRKNHARTYDTIADSVEQEFAVAESDVPAGMLGNIDTFRFEERLMLAHVGGLIAGGHYADASMLAQKYRTSFWAQYDLTRRQPQWELCALLADLGSEAQRVSRELQTMKGGAKGYFDRYVAEDGWHRMDTLHRRLEARLAQMADEPEAEAAVTMVRTKTDEVLRAMADAFYAAFETDKWTIQRTLHQTQIYPQKVAPLPGKIAWFHVDAMRYEMGRELARQLPEAAEMEITPAVAALPSITPLCMAALLPGASSNYSVVEHQGNAAAKIGKAILSNAADRMKYLKAEIPDSADVTLEQVLRFAPAKLLEKISNARLLAVRSQELDSLGEKHEMLARNVMETVIGNLARAVRRLATLGYERFVVTADHGHQFSSRKEDDMKVEAPGGTTLELHRRCWIGKGPSVPVGAVRVSGADLGYDSPLDFVFPQGVGVFKAGGGLSYHHGGFSLQELIIPVLSFRMSKTVGKSPSAGSRVKLTKDFQVITNRTFLVNVELASDLVASEPVRVRVVLMSEGEEVGAVGMANGATFNNEDKVLTIAPGQRANVVLLLTKEGVESVSILVQDAASPAVYDKLKNIPVKLRS